MNDRSDTRSDGSPEQAVCTAGGQPSDGGRQGGVLGAARTGASAVRCGCEPIRIIVVPSVVTFAMAPGKLQSAPDLQA